MKIEYVEDEFTSSFKADFKELMKANEGYNLKTILSGLMVFVVAYIFIASLIILL
jgi:hypothetical protein